MVSPGVSGSAIGQMIVGLALIIGLLFVGAFVLRKLNGGRGFGQTGPLRIIGGLMIGPRERIVMIEAGDAWIVIGIVPGQIRTLHTMPKGEIPATPDTMAPFSHWLKKMSEHHDAHK